MISLITNKLILRLKLRMTGPRQAYKCPSATGSPDRCASTGGKNEDSLEY